MKTAKESLAFALAPVGDAVDLRIMVGCVIETLSDAGYVIVPKEPTRAMFEAGATALYGHPPEQAEQWGKHDKWVGWGDTAAKAYRAMTGAFQ